MHERLMSLVQMSDFKANTEVEMGSDRAFGFVIAAVLMIISTWPTVFYGDPIRLWPVFPAVALATLALIYPSALSPLNRAWFLFGNFLGKIIAPIVMGIIFFITVTPIGFIRRIKNPDPLNQKFEPQSQTYWIDRTHEDPEASSMRRQF